MFDFGWSELAVIVVVALVVIGPKDLPRVIQGLGKWMRKARMAAGEFQRHVDDMVREADLQDVRDEVMKLKITGKMDAVRKMSALIDPDGKLANALDPTAMGLAASEGAAKLAAPTLDKPAGPILDKPSAFTKPAPSLDKPPAPALDKPGVADWAKVSAPAPYRAAGPADLTSFPGVDDDEILDRGAGDHRGTGDRGAGPRPYGGPQFGPRTTPATAPAPPVTPAGPVQGPASADGDPSIER